MAQKTIRHNVQSRAESQIFGDGESFTLHNHGMTVYFDDIQEKRTGYLFTKNGEEVAWIAEEETNVSPVAALKVAKEKPNEKVPFDD